MKNIRKILLTSVMGVCLCGWLNAADFSKHTEDELIKLSGSVKVADYPDYKIEIIKRAKQMKEKDAQSFKEKLKAQYEKATENMKVKELRAYEQSAREAMKKKIDTMTVKELKESGLDKFKNRNKKCPFFKDPKKDSKKDPKTK